MCGIAGFWLEGPQDPDILRAMTSTLAHRGPDGDGFFIEPPVGLGHRRLAIIDVEGGAQPIASEDGEIAVVFNGEIYNYRELRSELQARGHAFSTRSDTEVLVHLYEEEGEGFAARLNGIFAFALYDRARRKLLLGRDPVGVKPLYYARVPGGCLFGSELKALEAHPAFPRALDFRALSAYLVGEYVPAPLSIWAAARKLLPGHLLVVERGAARQVRFWNWDVVPEERLSEGEAAERLRAELQRSVKGQLVSDVPLGVFLSGGVDSSIVAACMKAAGGQVESFSIGFEDPSFDESGHARAAAAHLGCLHREHTFGEGELLREVPLVLAHLDEPLADPSVFPTALLSRFARGSVTVALGGDGGDELFGGYPTYWVHRRYGAYRSLPRWARVRTLALADRILPVSHANLTFPYKLRKFRDGAEREMPLRHYLWLGAWTPELLRELLPGSPPAPDLAEGWIPPSPRKDACSEAQWLDLHTYLLEDILAKVDRASMKASLEARVPILDPAVIRLAFSLPPGFKVRGTSGKRVFKVAFARDLPPGFLDRPKKGFGIPIARWLCGPLKPFAQELLSDDVLGRVPFIAPGVPRRLWSEHQGRRADHRKPLWALLCFLDWWRRKGGPA